MDKLFKSAFKMVAAKKRDP